MFSELSETAELHGTWFPRLEDGGLRLSEHDQRLLGSLTDEWLMPLDLGKRITKTPGWERLLWPFGGFVSVWRLRQWAAHGVVARQVRDPDNDNPLERDAFRLADTARALLAGGLESVGDAPPLYVGGCRLNDPAAPWVHLVDDSGWRIICLTART